MELPSPNYDGIRTQEDLRLTGKPPEISVGDCVQMHCEVCVEIRGHLVRAVSLNNRITNVFCPQCGTAGRFKRTGVVNSEGSNDRAAPAYDRSLEYRPGQQMTHPVYGFGEVVEVIPEGKIDVLFHDRLRRLIHERTVSVTTRSVQSWISAAGVTDTGLVWPENEDTLGIADLSRSEVCQTDFHWFRRPLGERGLLLAVADGMGGARGGAIASRIATEQMVGALMTDSKELPDSELLHRALQFVHLEVNLTAERNPALHGMGTTMTAAVVIGNQVIVGQVGDSRCYLLRGERLVRLTTDQTLVQSLIEMGSLTEEQAQRSPYRHVILNVIGQASEIEPIITETLLENGDVLLLCSDGLSNAVPHGEMEEITRQSSNPDEACARLVARANELGGEDNITVIVARFVQDESNETRSAVNVPVPDELF